MIVAAGAEYLRLTRADAIALAPDCCYPMAPRALSRLYAAALVAILSWRRRARQRGRARAAHDMMGVDGAGRRAMTRTWPPLHSRTVTAHVTVTHEADGSLLPHRPRARRMRVPPLPHRALHAQLECLEHASHEQYRALNTYASRRQERQLPPIPYVATEPETTERSAW